MKILTVTLPLVLAVAALVGGCKRNDSPPTVRETTNRALDNAADATRAAAQDMQDYAYAQKVQFVADMEKQLADLKRDIATLNTQIERSSDAVKLEARPKLKALQDQYALLEIQLQNVKDADETTWNDVKATSRKAFADLKSGFNSARQWMSDKIAP